MSARVAVIRFAGVNCEAETARALAAAGLAPEIVPWTASGSALAAFDAYVLPGGFSYQDRVRAGAVAARHELLEVVRERAERGAPVLGICNGAQVLVEAGLVPGLPARGAEAAGGAPGEAADRRLGMALAPNRMPDRGGYLARWVSCEIEDAPSLFTQAYAPGEIVPLPVAHAEGRFVTRDPDEWRALEAGRQIAMRYARCAEATGAAAPNPPGARSGGPEPLTPFPWNPNGSLGDAAAVGNRRGNVLALMPHPERAQHLAQVPLDLPGPWGERRRRARGDAGSLWSRGPGAGVFLSLAAALGAGGVAASVAGGARPGRER